MTDETSDLPEGALATQRVLLGSKLRAPATRPNLVRRERLLDRLDGTLTARLVLVSGPAGYGKTTLVADWLGRQTAPVAWLSLDSADNDPVRFLSYLVAALRSAGLSSGSDLEAALRSPQPPPVERLLAALVNDLSSLSGHAIMTLDDYHLITEQRVHEAVSFVLDHLPPQVHVIIATRADPPLPLARLRARAQLLEVRAGDLRFTLDETRSFLSDTMGLSIADESVELLERRTEGWIAGLQMAGISLRDRDDPTGFISSFSGSHRFVLDFLMEEVLARESRDVHDFLIRASVLGELSAPLCEAVIGREANQQMLKRLERENLFVVALDAERRWFRFHPLFADLLRARLNQTYPGSGAELHLRAGEWHESHGSVHEAVRHFLAGGHTERAAGLVERAGMTGLMRGETATIQRWLSELGADVARGRLGLCLLHAWTNLLTGALRGVEPWLLDAEAASARVESSDADHLAGQAAAIRAYMAAMRADATFTLEATATALERLPLADQSLRSMVWFTRGGGMVLSGDLPSALEAFREAAEAGRASGNLQIAVMAGCAVAGFTAVLGRLKRAGELYSEELRQVTRAGGQQSPLVGRIYSGLSELEYEWNFLEAAGRHAEEGIALGLRWANADVAAKCALVLATTRHALGDAAGAELTMAQAEQIARDHALVPDTAALVRAGRVRLSVGAGKVQAASRRARECGLSVGDQLSYMRETEHLALARVLLAEGRQGGEGAVASLETGLEFISRLEADAREGGRERRLVEILVLKALACAHLSDRARALAVLEEALALARLEGYVRTFLDEGQPIVELLRHLASDREPHRDYARELLAASSQGTAPPASAAAGVESLSEREMQVLRLIEAGKSNREIALQLVVAESTVKTHVNNLLGKLGARSRTQALAEARALGIL